MSGSVANYVDLVRDAHGGKLKLPGFQRQFKWARKQVVLLFDSIRQGYPLNGMIQIEGDRKELDAREFLGSEEGAAAQSAKRLVLDGQQRLTAGIHLFFNGSDDLKSQYFIDLQRLEEDLAEHEVNLENDAAVTEYLANLDVDAGYCKGRNTSADPYALLNKSHLLYTPLLLQSNSKKRDTFFDLYLEAYPSKKALIRNVIKPHFLVASGPSIPIINIEEEFQLDAISRIFATLNSTGKVLTPFELVVAVLFPKNIDLRTDIKAGRENSTYYVNMDKTGEIALQTAVLFAGGNPKKSLLPKTLTAEIWQQYGQDAFDWLDIAGRFLTEKMGMALNKTDSLVPYDSIFAPLASVLKGINYTELKGADIAAVNDKLAKWVVGSAITQRYQEGVHNKQAKDARSILEWLAKDGQEPDWLLDARVPGLTSVTPNGAIGRMIRALLNSLPIEDPVNQKLSGVGEPGAQLHHIFPTKFVEKLDGWDSKNDKANVLLNTMQINSETNGSFLNDDPVEQIKDAKNKNPTKYLISYERQGITDDALEILQKPQKSRADFVNFLKIRETYFERKLREYGFESGAHADEVDDSDEA